MSYSPPDPPHEVPADIVSKLDDQPPEVLRQVARFAEELAEYHEREARLAENEESHRNRRSRPVIFPTTSPQRIKTRAWRPLATSGR